MPRKRNTQPMTTWSQRILEYIAKHPDRPLKARRLARELDLPENLYPEFRALVREMLADGRLVLGPGRTLNLPARSPGTFRGIFRSNRRGFGFIEVPGQPDIYVPRQRTRGALDGDEIEARLIRPRYSGELRAEVVSIVKRATVRWVGVLQRRRRTFLIEPLGRGAAPLVVIAPQDVGQARPGQMVVVEPRQEVYDARQIDGRVTEVLGDPESTRVRILAVIRRFGLPDEFPAAVRREARKVAERYAADPAAAAAGREDLRKRLTITIDPPDARDFDDAITLRRRPHDRWELGVHIADVTHFVRPEGALDREARRRGTSVYFPGQVVPMLPEELSADVCSLRPGEDRLTRSVFITYDAGANVVATRFANTVIRSNARLTYDEVTEVLEGRASGMPPRIEQLLHNAAELARRIRQRRLQAGMIELTSLEVEVRLDEQGKVVDAGPASTDFSHKIIEMFMVEANEAVSRYLNEQGIAHLRRVHPEPEPQALQHFATVVTALGFSVQSIPDRTALNAVLARVRGKPAEAAVNMLALRSMAQATYSPADEGHYALASDDYCHFTSPIRRYPDLTVHRALAAMIARQAGRRRRPTAALPDEATLAELGRQTSESERRAQQAEREARSMLVLTLMRARIGQEFEGVITGVASFGAFVQVRPYCAEGLVSVSDFDDDRWDYDHDRARLLARRSGRVLTLGQKVRVVVAAVDDLRGEMTLIPAPRAPWGSPQADTRRTPARPRRGRKANARRRRR